MTLKTQRPPQSVGGRPPRRCGGRIANFFLCFSLIFEQTAFAQASRTLDISSYLTQARNAVISQDKFRPLHLRYISYDSQANDFKLLLDKGDTKFNTLAANELTSSGANELNTATQELLKYFFVGLALPNDKFWVNLRPDSPDNIIDDDLARTDIGRIFLEADVQLKKDTASFTSPQTPEGKDYWDKLYKRAEELFGTENITIPTLTRPWIVPNEIIIRESPEGAYIYKATLKVMLEEDYLRGTKEEGRGTVANYSFKDPRLKELNEYSTKLIRETIIPKLTYQVNTSKRYAPLRQVYYSLILAQWFKGRFSKDRDGSSKENSLLKNRPLNERTVPDIGQLIDSGNLTSSATKIGGSAFGGNLQLLTSQSPYSKQTYFQQYQKSFAEGEYNLAEPVYTPYGQSIRRYMSGGAYFSSSSIQDATTKIVVSSKGFIRNILSKMLPFILVSGLYIPSSFGIAAIKYEGFYEPHYYVESTDEINLKNKIDTIATWRGAEISVEEMKEVMLRVEKDNPGKDFTQDQNNVDVTSVVWWARFKQALSAGNVVLKDVLHLNSRQEAILYLVEANDNLAGETVENKIVVKLKPVRRQIESIRRKVTSIGNNNTDGGLFQKIYAATTERQLAISEILDVIYHEAIHALTREDISNGRINREYMENIFKKYNILQDEKHAMTLELVAYLGQLSSSQYPKRLLWEIFVKSSEDEKYRTCFEIITGELIKGKLGYQGGINAIDRNDFIGSLPDEGIKSFSSRLYYEIMAVNPPGRVFLAGLTLLLEGIVAEYDDAPMYKTSGSSPMQALSASSAVGEDTSEQSSKLREEMRAEPITINGKKYLFVVPGEWAGIDARSDEIHTLATWGLATCRGIVLCDLKNRIGTVAHVDKPGVDIYFIREMVKFLKDKGGDQFSLFYTDNLDHAQIESIIKELGQDPKVIRNNLKEDFAFDVRTGEFEDFDPRILEKIVNDNLSQRLQRWAMSANIEENIMPIDVTPHAFASSLNKFPVLVSSAVEKKFEKDNERIFYTVDEIIELLNPYFKKGEGFFKNIMEAEYYPPLIRSRVEAIGKRDYSNEVSLHLANGNSFLPFADMLQGFKVIISDDKPENMLRLDLAYYTLRNKISPLVFENSKMQRIEVRNVDDPDYFRKHYHNNSVDHVTVTNLISDPGTPVWELNESMRLVRDIFSVLRVGGTLTVSEDILDILNEFLKMYPRYKLGERLFIGRGSEFMRFYVFRLKEKPYEAISSSVTNTERKPEFIFPAPENTDKDKGGIDFAALPIRTQTMPGVSSILTSSATKIGGSAFGGNFKLPTSASILDLDVEWSQIQAIFNAGIRPSVQRISEYTAAAVASSLSEEKIDEVRAMLADILRREEEDEKLSTTDPATKNLIAALESES